jgi:hypothetical protein
VGSTVFASSIFFFALLFCPFLSFFILSYFFF